MNWSIFLPYLALGFATGIVGMIVVPPILKRKFGQ